MLTLIDKTTKTSWFNYFFMFCIIAIYGGYATLFARELGDIRTLGNAFALFITIVFFIKNRIRFNQAFWISILVFLSYAAVTSLNNRMINGLWIMEWLIWLVIAYGICKGFGGKLFVVVETVLYHLCIIGFAIWVIHLFYPSFVENLAKLLEFSKPYNSEGNVFANMIVYTVNTKAITAELGDMYFVLRNSGFAWEPGAFASYICLGVFCNILRNGLIIKGNTILIVFFVTLLSTQSTTGIMTLLLMLGIWLIVSRKILWGVLILPLALYAFSLPFVNDKLFEEINSIEYTDYTTMGKTSLGRTYSLVLNYEEFLRHPILGLGGYSGGTYYAKQGYEISLISGIGNLISQYGAIMSLLFIYLLVQSCKCIKELTGSPNAFILLAVILGMMYSYSIWTTPIYMAFWMFGAYNSRRVIVLSKPIVRC